MEKKKSPGQLAYEAHHAYLNSNPDFRYDSKSPWENATEDVKKAWELGAAACRRPLAEKLYSARHYVTRLLICYRDHLLGTWYEDTAKGCGISADGCGFLEHTYRWDNPGDKGADKVVDALASSD